MNSDLKVSNTKLSKPRMNSGLQVTNTKPSKTSDELGFKGEQYETL